LRFRFKDLKVFQPYYTEKALKSFTLFFYMFRDTRLGRAATTLYDQNDA
jgi:hypothetical protein